MMHAASRLGTVSRNVVLELAVIAAVAAPMPSQRLFDELPRVNVPLQPASGDFPVGAAFGDIDQDGDSDLLVAMWGGSALANRRNRLYRNEGSGRFVEVLGSSLTAENASTSAVRFGDVDGDGDLDVLVANVETLVSAPSRLFRNDGTGAFTDDTAGNLTLSGSSCSDARFVDVDGDGDLDIVATEGDFAGQTRLLLNDGTGAFSDVSGLQMPASAGTWGGRVTIADVDADGDPDLVLADYPTTKLYVNDGSGTFTDVSASQLPPQAFQAANVLAGDFDGDGDLDLYVVNRTVVSYYGYASNPNRLFLNDGSGTFADATTSWLGSVSNSETLDGRVLDADGDGDLDVVLVNRPIYQQYYPYAPYAGGTRLLLNDGLSRFVNSGLIPPDQYRSLSIAVADVDGDEDLDVLQLHRGAVQLSVNLQRQLDAPAAPKIGQSYTFDAYLRHVPPSLVQLAVIYVSAPIAGVLVPPYGTLRIDPSLAAPLPLLAFSPAVGKGTVSFVVPSQPALVGLEIASQAMLVAFPDDLRLSNVVQDVVGQ